jgi:hypothetical protein
MAYDLEAVAREIDRRLSEGQFQLKGICAALSIHRHSADRAIRKTYGCSFRQRRALWQTKRWEELTKRHLVTGRRLAADLGYVNCFSLKRRLRQLGVPTR